MIDLHLHTTASDGLLAPAALVERAAAAGLTTIAITDHDTVAGLPEATAVASRFGVRVLPGIEITAVERERDVHILGYFVNPESSGLVDFLRTQRADRVRRVREMAARLQRLGCAVDVERLVEGTKGRARSIGRPAIADALVQSGYARNRDDAFERLLGRGRPAFVPRRGQAGAEVIRIIHESGGVASLAHPGVMNDDGLIDALAGAGLDALEVWHSDHSPDQQDHYAGTAERLGLARSGGSDYHGEGLHRACQLGGVTLPAEELRRLEARAGTRP